jgi:NAD(P)-dependent dehydrogenase (short-subunit alcohol dehydrogenase family)
LPGPLGSARLKDRIALITGASRGIGRAVATRFATEGAHLVLVARTKGALEELDDEIAPGGGATTLVPLDLTSFDAIDQMGAAIHERFGRLDVLIGNAGELGTLGPLAHTDPATWDQVIATNLTANWRLLRSLDPLLRLSDAGRAVFVTSGAGRMAIPYWGAYAISKAALEMMVKVYAAEVAKTSVRANIIDPGIVRTSMRATAFPGEDPMSLPAPDNITEAFVALSEAVCTRNGEVVAAN